MPLVGDTINFDTKKNKSRQKGISYQLKFVSFFGKENKKRGKRARENSFLHNFWLETL
jgi:hypothetical protein